MDACGSYIWWRHFWYAFQRVETASARDIFSFDLCPFSSHGVGGVDGKGCRCLSTLSGGAIGMHASESGGKARGTLIHFAYSPVQFSRTGGGGGGGVSAALTLSGGAFSSKRAGHMYFWPFAVQFSRIVLFCRSSRPFLLCNIRRNGNSRMHRGGGLLTRPGFLHLTALF